MTYCGSQTAVKTVDRTKYAVSLRCRSWGCVDCGDNRKKMLVAQAIGGQPSKFLTLTLRRSEAPTPVAAAKMLVLAWRQLRLDIMKDMKWTKLPFLAVFEPHKSGWPHLHILIRSAFIDVKFIKAWMETKFNSFKQDIRAIDHASQVAGYCAKYCSKGAAKFGTVKRYWQSRDYDKRPPPLKTWRLLNDPFREVIPATLTTFLNVYRKQGWVIDQSAAWKATLKRPP